ncbi:adenosylcobinamide-GDP ribazoletransferase [Aneurinibacillus sp. Ricciae_BoGa-3]|uniref:adenosylcobinamide-GDP ribazoletransferase n=1 Tax=Aneurinibacillus sp. Ricciae_BoGa-3 TaxID=3022697 RepID=UPI002340A953|nr:adenosylcobinamide-GDP ribazoletransferase [Aneurinibacillus sp. Ricciae_BoGa-3]WCK53990.1 adenosylcobinamide-GDP ribazoletransferase [Aneurinibacillus sp. Ricciae_BoGa-3]
MNAFFHALAFLTRIPVPHLSQSAHHWQKSVIFYPLVGALMGGLLCLCGMAACFLFPRAVAAVLILVCWVFLTGGLHLDGWMDLADGIGSSRPREKIFEIMKDSRVGAMGVIAAVLLLLVKAAALYEIMGEQHLSWLIVPPLMGRLELLIAIRFWPYITEKGLGTGLRMGLSRSALLVNLLLAACVLYALNGAAGLVVYVMALGFTVLFIRMIVKKLGGLTGDCYGAVVEWTEALSLLLIVAAGRWM